MKPMKRTTAILAFCLSLTAPVIAPAPRTAFAHAPECTYALAFTLTPDGLADQGYTLRGLGDAENHKSGIELWVNSATWRFMVVRSNVAGFQNPFFKRNPNLPSQAERHLCLVADGVGWGWMETRH